MSCPGAGARQYLSWILFALAVYVRPESFLLPVFLIADIIIRRLAFRQKLMFWRGLASYAAVILPYLVLNLALVHSIFPQTYVAKVGRTSLFTAIATGDTPQIELLLFKAPVMYLGGFVTHLWRANPVLVLLALAGMAVLVVHFVKYLGQASLLIPLGVFLYAQFVGMTARRSCGPRFRTAVTWAVRWRWPWFFPSSARSGSCVRSGADRSDWQPVARSARWCCSMSSRPGLPGQRTLPRPRTQSIASRSRSASGWARIRRPTRSSRATTSGHRLLRAPARA